MLHIQNQDTIDIQYGKYFLNSPRTYGKQCKAGHLADSCRIVKEIRDNKNSRYEYAFFVHKCRQCPFKDECNPGCKKAKRYRVTILSDEHKK